MIEPIKSGNDVPSFDFSERADVRERLKEVLERIGSLVKAGQIAGVTDEQIARWRDGKAKPSFAGVAALTYAAGRSLDWLVAGEEHARRDFDLTFTDANGIHYPIELKSQKSDLREIRDAIAKETELPGFTLVPRLDVKASAGNGLVAYDEDTLDYLAFQEGWLRAKGVNPMAARVITATGDSMEETIRDGDVLLVDTSIDRVKDNAIYIVAYGDLLLVKRLHKRINGSLQLISDNPRYPPEEVTAGEVDQLNIAGRVMWFGRSI